MKLYKTDKDVYYTKKQEAENTWYIYRLDETGYELFNGDRNCGVYESLGRALEEVERVEEVIRNAKAIANA